MRAGLAYVGVLLQCHSVVEGFLNDGRLRVPIVDVMPSVIANHCCEATGLHSTCTI
jgi:hypothetical protein